MPIETTIPDPQDQFALAFHSFMEKNFARSLNTHGQMYMDIVPKGKDKQVLYTEMECLDLFKKQQIPALPKTTLEEAIFLLDKALKKGHADNCLLRGINEIMDSLQKAGPVNKQEIYTVIANVLNQIS